MTKLIADGDLAAAVDECIYKYFERHICDAVELDPSYQTLWQALYELIQSGGKRLRPQIVLIAYAAFGGKDTESMLPVAAAQELLHFSLLIHDDVIDRDYTRYNTLNIAGRYKELYAKFLTTEADQVHFAHSTAILAGDLMLSGAHELIAQSNLGANQKATAQRLLSRSVFEVAGGELLDTELSFVPYTNGDALKVARYKTASYSFTAPLLTGALIAGCTDREAALLEDFAVALGTAYQLVDDVLGTFGDEKTTGKSTTSDITEGKRTYLIEQTLNGLSAAEKRRFDTSFGMQHATESDIQYVKQLIISTGAKEKTERMISDYAHKAHSALAKLKLNEEQHKEFTDLIASVTERTY